jgi:phenylacetate-CoA ligase
MFSKLINRFDLSLQLNGYPLKRASVFLQQIVSKNELEFENFLTQQKTEIFNFHIKNNPFYKDFIGVKKIESWSDIPVLKKYDFQKPLSERLTEGFSKKNVFINKTSGSSGNPLVFARDKFCHALIWANIQRRLAWYGLDMNSSKQARFYGMSLNFLDNKKIRIKDFLSNRYRFNIFDLSDKGIKKMIGKFSQTKFDYINGYTNSIVAIARYCEQNNLYLNEICPSLKVCIVTSEMLFDDDKKLLESRFRIPIVNEYGSAELEIIAFENTENQWLVNSETLFVEILDENDNVLPHGTEGRIVVTSLFNEAHPMIRFDMGDFGILDKKSTLQKPILQKLLGRTNDVAVLPSGKVCPGMTFYSITKKLFHDDGNVKEFIIKQTKINEFEISYTSFKPLENAEILKIEKVFSTFLEPNLNYVFVRNNILTREKSGKLKQFISQIN